MEKWRGGKENGKRPHGGVHHKTTGRVGCCSWMDGTLFSSLGRSGHQRGSSKEPTEAFTEEKNPGRIGKNKVDCDAITQERAAFLPLYCSCPPYFDSDKVENNSPRGGRKEREANVKTEKVGET